MITTRAPGGANKSNWASFKKAFFRKSSFFFPLSLVFIRFDQATAAQITKQQCIRKVGLLEEGGWGVYQTAVTNQET